MNWNATLLVDREGDDIRAYWNSPTSNCRRCATSTKKWTAPWIKPTKHSRAYGLPRIFASYGADLRGRQLIDNAVFFEGVNNTLKLIGDQYLAGVYRLVSRLSVEDWE